MASNNKSRKNRKLSKNKLMSIKQQLLKSIGGCYGCQECKDSQKKLREINVLLGISSQDI
jgi:hypothetical protein